MSFVMSVCKENCNRTSTGSYRSPVLDIHQDGSSTVTCLRCPRIVLSTRTLLKNQIPLTLRSPPHPLWCLCSSAGSSEQLKPGRSWSLWRPRTPRCQRKWWWAGPLESGWPGTRGSCPWRAGSGTRAGRPWAGSTPCPPRLHRKTGKKIRRIHRSAEPEMQWITIHWTHDFVLTALRNHRQQLWVNKSFVISPSPHWVSAHVA